MELRQLRYFVTVAKTLNFTDAARELYITQGTLSQQIRQLEDELGASLFVRSSHSVELSEAGKELLPLAIRTIEASDDCRSRVQDLQKGLSGSLNIGVTSSFSRLITETVKQFVKQYPGVKLNIFYKTATELIEMLHERQLDFMVSFKPHTKYEKLDYEPIFVSRLSAVMRKDHPLAGRRSLTFKDLEGQGIALPGSGLQARRTFERFINVDTSELDIRIEMNDPNIIMDIVRGTNLIAILSSLASYYYPGLIAIPLDLHNSEMIGCIQWLREGYRKKSADIFLDMLRESAQISNIQFKYE